MAKKRTTGSKSDSNGGEFRGGKMGTAVISGSTFTSKSVTYHDVNGMAILEGDIALGTVQEVEQATREARAVVISDPSVAFGVGIPGSRYRWPNCRIPYEIDPNLPNQQRVTDAIAHWEANTAFRFPLRTPANAAQYPNYVYFTDAGGCWSLVGMRGGMQKISLGSGCSKGNAIHEIGHTVGLWHEQSREDRDLFVTINWQNIQSGMSSQFNQHITDGDDLGAYDYGSIMHYPRTAFSANGQETITPTDPNAQIGQRNGLSAGDIAAVRQMYPACAVVKFPQIDIPKFKKIRDDQRFKKIVDERPFKKLRDDIGKPFRDPKPPFDPGPIKTSYLDPMPPIRPTLPRQPGTLLPFSIATPHHAEGMGFGMSGDPTADPYRPMVEQELLDIEAQIAQAMATIAQSQADVTRLQQAADSIAAALGDEGYTGGGS